MYGAKHDDAVLAAAKNLKSPEDVADSGAIGEAVKAIDAVIEKEEVERTNSATAGKQPTGTGGSGTPPPPTKKEPENQCGALLRDMIERITAKGNSVDDDLKSRIEAKETEVTRLFDAHCAISEIPTSEKKVIDWLNSTAAGRARGEKDKSFVGIIVDPGVLGEPVTAPHLRINSVQTPIYKARFLAWDSRDVGDGGDGNGGDGGDCRDGGGGGRGPRLLSW